MEQESIMEKKNIGIVDIEVYYPKLYAEQTDLELYCNVPNKFTHGLGQSQLGFCSNHEDTVSMAMTAIKRLITRTGIHYNDIGRLDVGTETMVDLSKSIKSYLMQLFSKEGNTDLEGADNINACYGGTAALFNCIDWIESSYWNGKYGMVVTADVSVYNPSMDLSAVSTSGAGAVCLLIGVNAPLVFKQGIRANHMFHTYDFYKPVKNPYPVVDGALSIKCYIESLISCSSVLVDKMNKVESFSLQDPNNFFAFHCPYSKLVQKGFSYMLHVDDERFHCGKEVGLESALTELTELWSSTNVKDFEGTLNKKYKDNFEHSLLPSLLATKRIGNSYCSSLYMCLSSILSNVSVDNLKQKRIILFSYGSGALSSMFVIEINQQLTQKLGSISENLKKSFENMNNRRKCTIDELLTSISDKSKHHAGNLNNISSNQLLWDDCYYLSSIDNLHRRFYEYHEK